MCLSMSGIHRGWVLCSMSYSVRLCSGVLRQASCTNWGFIGNCDWFWGHICKMKASTNMCIVCTVVNRLVNSSETLFCMVDATATQALMMCILELQHAMCIQKSPLRQRYCSQFWTAWKGTFFFSKRAITCTPSVPYYLSLGSPARATR